MTSPCCCRYKNSHQGHPKRPLARLPTRRRRRHHGWCQRLGRARDRGRAKRVPQIRQFRAVLPGGSPGLGIRSDRRLSGLLETVPRYTKRRAVRGLTSGERAVPAGYGRQITFLAEGCRYPQGCNYIVTLLPSARSFGRCRGRRARLPPSRSRASGDTAGEMAQLAGHPGPCSKGSLTQSAGIP